MDIVKPSLVRKKKSSNTLAYIPLGHLSGLISTAMMREAPASLQPMITARPTAPQPQTATLLPDSTLAVFRAAP